MIDFKDKNVLVTGGNGMIGQALVELLYDTTSANIMVADLPNVDLRDRKDCKDVCEGQDIVFHLAGIKGSPQRCMEAPASFSVPMIQFNANMVEAAYNADVEYRIGTAGGGNQARQPYLSKCDYKIAEELTNANYVHDFGLYIGNHPELDSEEVINLCDKLNLL